VFTGKADVTTFTPPPPAQSLNVGVAGEPLASPVQMPAYLHKVARPGATPNVKVRVLC